MLLWTLSIPLWFDRARAAKTFKMCQNEYGYVKVKTEPGKNILFALTEKGFKRSLEVIESIYNERCGRLPKDDHSTDKEAAFDEFILYEEYVKRRDIQVIMKKYPTFIGRQREIEKLFSFLNDPMKPILLITGNGVW